jgi:hypothetical protein
MWEEVQVDDIYLGRGGSGGVLRVVRADIHKGIPFLSGA